ncbi:MAG TPA: hypothetical protein VMG08_18280 [Allosphingosinicella sp.]|nr:hypothetical protein [Allosphingosinicella sp.]
MRKMIGVALLALAMQAAGPAAAQPSAQPSFAARMAQNFQASLPRRYGENVELVAATAQGNMLVLTIVLHNGASMGREEIARIFAAGFCEGDNEMDQIFRDGLRIRVDVRGGGVTQSGVIVDRCPAG